MIPYSLPPVQIVNDPALESAGVSLSVLREDLNHAEVSGNKWWKLKYNLRQAKADGHDSLLTFGGAYSNHIHATAAAASVAGFKSIGLIRGELTLPLNPTLSFAVSRGMQLRYVDRSAYRHRTEPDWVSAQTAPFGECYVIPEGGTNALAIKGCAEWGTLINAQHPFDYLCLPVGTGGTMAGLLTGLQSAAMVLGFSVLKDGDFLNQEVRKWLTEKSHRQWQIMTGYAHGGYAKTNEQLNHFIHSFENTHRIPLEFVYSGKMMWGVYDLAAKGFFPRGSRILALHTGGVQAKSSHN